MHRAGYTSSANLARLFLVHGANVNAEDNQKRTPLHCAAQYGSVEVIKLLLANGANTSSRDTSGYSPADEARLEGQHYIVDFLETGILKEPFCLVM
jgi:ankyrin repeat protein